MWVLDLIMLAVAGGGFLFWYHFFKRNVTTTHQVVKTEDYYNAWKVLRVTKFFGKKVSATEMASRGSLEKASETAIQCELELRQKEAAKRITGVYEIGDLERLMLEQKNKE